MTVSAPDARNIIGHVPGQLCVDATDLTAAFPHGGTALGEVADAVLIREAPVQLISAEEFGNEPVEAVSGGEAWSLAASLRSWNKQAYSEFFLNAAAGGTSGHPLVQGSGTNRAGYLYSARSAVFVFSPMNLDLHPMVVFYKGMPMVEDTSELAFHLGGDADRLEVPVVIVGIRDGSDRVIKVGRRSDISLA